MIYKKFSILLLILTIFLTFGNIFFFLSFYPLLLIFLFFLNITLIFLSSKTNVKITKLQIIVLFIFIYSVISLLLSGININIFLNYEFLRRDGKFFITFIPYLIIPFYKNQYNINFQKIIKYFIYFITIISLLYLLFNFQTILTGKEINFFFSSHNAAGGFYSNFFILTYFYLKEKKLKNLKNILILFSSILFIILTISLGSIIGLLFATLYYMINNYKFDQKLKNMLMLCIFIFIFLFFILIESYITPKWIKTGRIAGGINTVDITLNNLKQEGDFTQNFFKMLNFKKSKMINIYDRIYQLWPKAWEYFTLSPLIGIGFSRYNDDIQDMENDFYGIKNVFYISKSRKIVNADNHAHNSYFHILAEQGLFGLFLYILFVYYYFKSLKNIKEEFSIFKNYLFYSMISIIYSSFTEHRFVTPSQVLPTVIIYVIVMYYLNSQKYIKGFNYENTIDK